MSFTRNFAFFFRPFRPFEPAAAAPVHQAQAQQQAKAQQLQLQQRRDSNSLSPSPGMNGSLVDGAEGRESNGGFPRSVR